MTMNAPGEAIGVGEMVHVHLLGMDEDEWSDYAFRMVKTEVWSDGMLAYLVEDSTGTQRWIEAEAIKRAGKAGS